MEIFEAKKFDMNYNKDDKKRKSVTTLLDIYEWNLKIWWSIIYIMK